MIVERDKGRDVQPSRRDAVSDWLDVFTRMLGLPRAEAGAVRDELEDHLRSRVEDLLITGHSEPEAVRKAVAELGETAELAQRYRVARRSPRRRMAMHVALFTIAGTALLAASTAVMQNHNVGVAPGGQSSGVAAAQQEERYGETLHRYDVRDLVQSEQALGYNAEAQQLIETVVSLVQPEQWDENGGDVGHISVVGNTLFIDAPEDMQAGVRWTLDALRADAEQIRAQSLREAEEERARVAAAWEEDRARREEAKQRAAEERSAQLEALRAKYEQMLDRSFEIGREMSELSAEQSKLMQQTETSDRLVASLAQIQLRQNQLFEESKITGMRLTRARDLLVDAEFAGFERLSGRSADVFDVPTPSVAPAPARSSSRAPSPDARATPKPDQEHLLDAMRSQMVQLTAQQMREVAMLAIQYANDHDGRFPNRPSQLRDLAEARGRDYDIFLPPVARGGQVARDLAGVDDPWKWLDENPYFELVPGELYNAQSVIVREAVPTDPSLRIMAFGDSHVDVVAASK